MTPWTVNLADPSTGLQAEARDSSVSWLGGFLLFRGQVATFADLRRFAVLTAATADGLTRRGDVPMSEGETGTVETTGAGKEEDEDDPMDTS